MAKSKPILYQLKEAFRGQYPKGYRFNSDEAKKDKDVFILSLSGVTITGGNTVEIPASIVEEVSE